MVVTKIQDIGAPGTNRERAGARWIAAALAVVLVTACSTVPDGAPRSAADPAGAAGSGTESAPAGGRAAEAVDSSLALQTFDSAWSRIAHTHYDSAYRGVDWPAVRDELRPRAASVRTLPALRGVLMDMLGRLGESHFSLLPREVAGAIDGGAPTPPAVDGDVGLEVRLVGEELLVWRLDPSGPAAAAGVRSGWTVLGVDDRRFGPRVASLLKLPAAERRTARTMLLLQANAELSGRAGDSLTLRLKNESGAELDRRVPLRPRTGQVVSFGSLPTMIALLESEQVTVAGGCVGIIRFNIWLVPLASEFDRAVDDARGCVGMIVDLRGNPGGVAGMVMGTAGHFLSDTLPLGFMKTRTTELRFKANPRRVRPDGTRTEPFAGRVAVLTDEMTASTSEFFAEGLQGVGRARVFGVTSAGQALPAMMTRLPTGDVLMHVLADFTGPNGSRIEGRGVVPDVRVETTRQNLLQEHDAVMSAALDWIAGQGAGPPGGSTP